jgi:hypothetical protein
MLAGPWRRFRATRGATRELLTLALSLLLGLLVAPAVVYGVGHKVLGDYAHGGYASLMGDVLRALAAGAVPFWLLILGPYAAVWVWRLWRWSWRAG